MVGTPGAMTLRRYAADALEKAGTPTRVVSLPCSDLFDCQPAEYRRSVIAAGVPTVFVEAGITFGLERYSHFQVSMNNFGQSAPGAKVFDFYGFTPQKVAASVTEFLGVAETYTLPIQRDSFKAKYLAEFSK